MRVARPDGTIAFGTVGDDVPPKEMIVREGNMYAHSEPNGEAISLDAVEVLSPCEPTKIIGLWNNFHEAAEKAGWATPLEPLFFFKPPSCVIGNGAAVMRPSSYSGRILYEGELGVVIGTSCADVPLDAVDEVIFGYTCVNDVTAFELITEDASFPQWCRAKSFDTFGAIGPAIATGIDPDGLRIRTFVGGKVRQDYPVSDMFFSPRELVSRVSRGMTLVPGDVIACGTSLGAMPMRPGVTVEIAIEGVGVLTNCLAE
jgi:2-keto-4-pentenoate hydratase/2-oxohepta-3-ene-1,7-dioic acid hydratase in catechol pathway